MKKIKWKVTCRGAYVDSGSVEAEGDREALDAVLAREVGSFPVAPEKSYAITAGSLTASAYGDEFEAVRGAAYLDDKPEVDGGGHLFAPPKVAGLPCAHPSMNRDVWIDGEKYAQCDDCDFVAPDPVVRRKDDPLGDVQGAIRAMDSDASGVDLDRLREDRELARAIEKAAADGDLDPASARDLLKGIVQGVARATVRKLAEEALRKALEAVPVGGFVPRSTPCAPSDHKVVEHRREEVQGTSYYCRACDGHFLLADVDQVMRRVPFTEAEIRERLSR